MDKYKKQSEVAVHDDGEWERESGGWWVGGKDAMAKPTMSHIILTLCKFLAYTIKKKIWHGQH